MKKPPFQLYGGQEHHSLLGLYIPRSNFVKDMGFIFPQDFFGLAKIPWLLEQAIAQVDPWLLNDLVENSAEWDNGQFDKK